MVTKKTIKKWNTYFNSLSPAEKRVAIAKDVLEQIKANRLHAQTGTYFDLDTKLESDQSIQANLNDVRCNACALGGMMLSHIKYNNECTVGEGDDINSTYIKNKLTNYFDEGQLALIEIAFEQWIDVILYNLDIKKNKLITGIYEYRLLTDLNLTEEQVIKAGNYFNGDGEIDSQDRLIQIMQNIIKNAGIFSV